VSCPSQSSERWWTTVRPGNVSGKERSPDSTFRKGPREKKRRGFSGTGLAQDKSRTNRKEVKKKGSDHRHERNPPTRWGNGVSDRRQTWKMNRRAEAIVGGRSSLDIHRSQASNSKRTAGRHSGLRETIIGDVSSGSELPHGQRGNQSKI